MKILKLCYSYVFRVPIPNSLCETETNLGMKKGIQIAKEKVCLNYFPKMCFNCNFTGSQRRGVICQSSFNNHFPGYPWWKSANLDNLCHYMNDFSAGDLFSNTYHTFFFVILVEIRYPEFSWFLLTRQRSWRHRHVACAAASRLGVLKITDALSAKSATITHNAIVDNSS